MKKRRQRRRKELPTAETTITGLSHDGRGISQIEGKTTFIAGALVNEKVEFKYTKCKSTFDEGHVTQIIEASNDRQAAKCEHFGVCGGCSLQHMLPEQQIAYKQAALLELLQHQAQTQPQSILPPLTADSYGYRTKARLGVKFVPGKDKVLVGFREKDSRFLANLNQCEVLHPSVGYHLNDISQMLYQLSARDTIPQIEVAVDDKETALIIRHLQPLIDSDILQIKQFAKDFNYKIYFQPKGIDTVHLVYPEQASEKMQYKLHDFDLSLEFHPSQFTQVNHKINQQMIQQAITLLDIKPTDKVLDLFCGIGNFTLPIATTCQSIVGVEGDQSAIDQAILNASANGITNTDFFTENLFEPPFESWSQQSFDKILLDPPRSGAKEVIECFPTWKPTKIVYVSCNPSTLARDAGLLVNQGYTLTKAGVMDMFPHTQHIEAIALFEKT